MRAGLNGLGWIDTVLLIQRGHLFPWVPVMFAVGIGIYFSVPVEPGTSEYAALGGLGLLSAGAALRWPGGLAALAWGLALAAAGFVLAGQRANSVAGPVLEWRYYGPVEGRVVALDRSASDAVRVTLDQVVLARTDPDRVPRHVRLSLHGPPADLIPGQRIMTTAHLSPPQGPVEPGGFDFRRHAWFQELGGVGYTRVPVLLVEPADAGQGGLRTFALRMAVSNYIREALPGDAGGFAAAVTSGDRSGVTQDTLHALRASNLAHLLAISGLHMGLLAGFVFGLLRLTLAAVPPLALRLAVRKIAALGALCASAIYLALSGGNVATERAFIMVAVMLCAILVNRRAISLRAVALAAMIVLILRPEALLGPGFQMSFAATTALVAVFGVIRDADLPRAPNWTRPIMGVLISSSIAGLATAPIGAAHFNTTAHYGLIANLVSVPVMGTLVIPAAVLSVILWPIGLDGVGLWLMGMGLRWILSVAHWVTGLEGAQGFVHSPGPLVLPLLSLGMLFVILWQGRVRFAGLAPAGLALVLWTGAERPQVLVADSGGLVGVMQGELRALSKERGSGFVARNWLENDGDGVTQPVAAARWPDGQGPVRRLALGDGKELIHLIGKRGAAAFNGCENGQIIVASIEFSQAGDCEIYDLKRLRQTGSLAIHNGKLRAANDVSGARIWNTAPQ